MPYRFFSEKTLEFVIPGRPLQQGAPRNRVELQKEGLHDTMGEGGYINLIRMVAKAAVVAQKWEIGANEPVYVVVTIYLDRHNTTFIKPEIRKMIKRGTLLPIQRPDVNRISELVIKALKGIVWANNKQLVGLLVTKKYNQEEGVEVLVGNPKTWRELNHDLRNS